MPAYVSKPSIRLAPHKVTNDDLSRDLVAHHPEHPKLKTLLRLINNCGVEARFWSRPFEEAAALSSVAERAHVAFGDALQFAVPAAFEALGAAGLEPWDVDAVITSHTSSWTVPNLDVHLVNRLGLRPTVTRMAMTTVACAGGAQALIRAVDFVKSHPGSKVLVVVAETLSTIYHRYEVRPQNLIYKSLFGDSAGACIVTGEPAGSFRVDDTLELCLPDSIDRYWGTIDVRGLHFDSTTKAATAARDALPYLHTWLGDQRPEWMVIHPGGPRIVQDVAAGLEMGADKDGRHSLASLRENGNLGGAAVLDVLRRTHDDPPAAGAHGLLAAFGPGFIVAAVRGTWE